MTGPNLYITATEDGSAIYLNGRFTGKTTPDTLKVQVGNL
ncbi:MAG: PEGA domain-containing protein [Chloroflexia bacterium]|nr:PEGA domain-containing protein [Chloroflexia bacterium]